MTLEDKIKKSLSQTILRDEGRLILENPELLELGWSKNNRRHLIAENLEGYLSEKIEQASNEREKENYQRLLTAFLDYHDIRIGDLDVNIYFQLKPKKELFDFTIPDLDEIEQDILKLNREYQTQLLISTFKKTGTLDERKVLSLMCQNTLDPGDLSKILLPFRILFDDFNFDKFEEHKSLADQYIQKYCPTLDLSKVKIVVRDKFGSKYQAGGVKHKNKEVHILNDYLKKEMDFYQIYSHEVAHLDGVLREGMAEYVSMQVISDLAKDFPNKGFGLLYSQELLSAATHTYIIERKLGAGKRKGIEHLKEVLNYHFKKKCSKPFIDLHEDICSELEDMGVSGETYMSLLIQYEDLKFRKQVGYLMQKIVNDDCFAGGYTRDLYLLMKKKGEV